MRIDAHQHYWDLQRFKYAWMPPAPSPLARNYLPDDLEPILSANRFDGSIVVQANTNPKEAWWLLDLARHNQSILGIVAWVDLESPDLAKSLDRLQQEKLFCGVRHPAHDESDPKWLLRPSVIAGPKELERRKLPFDLLLRPPNFVCVEPLAEQLPNLTLILDHLGKPSIKSRQWDDWAAAMARFAQLKNLNVKVSGMITEAAIPGWQADDLKPYVQHVLTTFGPDRLLFGSDWPVCLLAGTWKQTLAAFTQALGAQTVDLRERILGGTAARVYNIKPR